MSNGSSAAVSAMLLCKFKPLTCKRARSIGLTNPNWFFTAPVSVQMACVFSTGREIFRSNDCGTVDKESVNPRSLRRFSKGLLLRLMNLTPRSSQTRFSGRFVVTPRVFRLKNAFRGASNAGPSPTIRAWSERDSRTISRTCGSVVVGYGSFETRLGLMKIDVAELIECPCHKIVLRRAFCLFFYDSRHLPKLKSVFNIKLTFWWSLKKNWGRVSQRI